MTAIQRWTQEQAEELIRSEYEGSDDLWGDASYFRVGTGHEETPRGGDTYCAKCGRLDKPTAHPSFHPEVWVSEDFR